MEAEPLDICFGFDVLLTVHLSTFISVFNQFDAQNLFHNKFYFIPLHVSSTCAHHQEVKIALHSLWYYHTYRWPVHETATYKCDELRGCVMQFWPPDEQMCSKHAEAWNKTYCETKFCVSSWLNTEINMFRCIPSSAVSLSMRNSCWQRTVSNLRPIRK